MSLHSSGTLAYSVDRPAPAPCIGSTAEGPPCEAEPELVEVDVDPEVYSAGWTCPACGTWNPVELP